MFLVLSTVTLKNSPAGSSDNVNWKQLVTFFTLCHKKTSLTFSTVTWKQIITFR